MVLQSRRGLGENAWANVGHELIANKYHSYSNGIGQPSYHIPPVSVSGLQTASPLLHVFQSVLPRRTSAFPFGQRGVPTRRRHTHAQALVTYEGPSFNDAYGTHR